MPARLNPDGTGGPGLPSRHRGMGALLRRLASDHAGEEPSIRITKESSDRYQPPRGGLLLIQGLILLFLVVFISRFWFLQIHEGAVHARKAQENHWRQEHISAPRGRIFDARGRVVADNRTAWGLSLIKDDVRDLPATLAQVSAWTGVPQEQIEARYNQGHFKVKPFEPLLLVTELGFDLVARIESELHAWPGLEIVIQTKRTYPESDLLAHILGYVAEANGAELEKNPELDMGDLIGKGGIELTLDERLRGKKGLYDIEVDVSGHMLGRRLALEPKGGEELHLAIDVDIQRACWEALGNQVGSVVVMEPDTGKLRALVTKPAYDNNLFAAGISHKDWSSLRTNPLSPMQNRAMQSRYPPGSVWKLMMAACILENGISPNAAVNCSGGVRLGKQVFHCWRRAGHGSQDLVHALINSCDSYFYVMADRLGIDKIESFARKCGFGKATGIDLPHESSGLVPGKAWKRRRHKRGWSRGDTFNASIGQGDVLTTPLQIATYVSALLNGGRLLKPQIVDDPPTVMGMIPARRSTRQFVVDAMRRTASVGTARAVHRTDADMGGKTGSAQVVRLRGQGQAARWKDRDHAWFASWGHKNDKTYVIVVMVEHGGGGGKVAGPIAAAVYDFLFANDIYTFNSLSNAPARELPGPPLPPELAREKTARRVVP